MPIFFIFSFFCSGLFTYAQAENNIKIEELTESNRLLNDRLSKLESTSTSLLSNSKVNVGGYVKADMIYDIQGKSGDRINYTSIPIKGSSADEASGHFRFHARETRLNITWLENIDKGQLKIFSEGDFFGGGTNSPPGSEVISNSANFRLRHAYAQWNSWLLGQTWSNYVDVKSFPENLDFSNDTGQAFLRQAQLRYSHNFGLYTLSSSIENPESDFTDDSGAKRVNAKDKYPDITLKIRMKKKWGHISLQSVLRHLSIDDGSFQDSGFGYGVGFSGKVKVLNENQLRFHLSGGEGIGRYLQEASNSAAVVENPGTSFINMETQKSWGGYLGYQHWWTPALRSNLNGGYLKTSWREDVLGEVTNQQTKLLKSFHVNLIWRAHKYVDIGIEYSRAMLERFDGQEGEISRLQFSGKFKF